MGGVVAQPLRSKSEVDVFDLRGFDTVLLDMDGVLYRGQQPLPGVGAFLAFLRQQRIAYTCVTNNSTLTPKQYESKLRAMGLAISASHVLTSSIATRRFLERQAPYGTPIFYIGMEGLRTALLGDGYFTLDAQHPQYVIVGLDFDITYAKLRTAALAIRAGAHFVGTNPDTTLPTEEGIVPGAGSLLALLQAATGVPPFVIGKPEPEMLHVALAALDSTPERTLVIGDRLDTDIAGARAAGIASVMVLTGVSTRDDLTKSVVQPDSVYAGLPDLLVDWSAQRG